MEKTEKNKFPNLRRKISRLRVRRGVRRRMIAQEVTVNVFGSEVADCRSAISQFIVSGINIYEAVGVGWVDNKTLNSEALTGFWNDDK